MPQLQETIPNGIQQEACVALYDNNAETPEELSFRSGDILTIVQKEAPGLEGWWVCSLRGKQGICPRNRVRQLTEPEVNLLRERRRRSWNTAQQSAKVGGGPQKPGDLYDLPPQAGGEACFQDPHFQYDVPLTGHPQPTPSLIGGEESYDVPKPVNGGLLTPSSSVSSLTTDSNRSSLIHQDYDVPRPSRPAASQKVGQVTYDVPRAAPEAPLELTAALDLLGRLESDVTAAISRLLGYPVPHWRSKARLEPRLAEIRAAASRLGTSLHQLALFVQTTHHSLQDRALGDRLGPLVQTVVEADATVGECLTSLQTAGWKVALLAVEDPTSHQVDTLDRLISCAAVLTDDVRQIASFIQGNSTLLFKRNVPVGGGCSEETTYQNMEGERNEGEDGRAEPRDGEDGRVEPRDGEDGRVEPTEADQPPDHYTLDPQDRKVVELYCGQYWVTSSRLALSIDSLLTVVTQNQPPKSFLARAKAVLAAGHEAVSLGDALVRGLSCQQLRGELQAATHLIAEALSNLVHKTKSAAVHFPSVAAVQYMVDSVVDLSHRNRDLRTRLLLLL